MKPYYEDEWVTIYHGDCREVLPELPKVDLVLTDPPYGIGWVGSGTIGGHPATTRDWDGIVGDDKEFERIPNIGIAFSGGGYRALL